MEAHYLLYTLQDGWICNWLVAGPQSLEIPDSNYKYDAALRAAIVQNFLQAEPLAPPPFIEGAAFSVENAPLSWRYYACQDDHLIDLAGWFPSSRFVRVWAYVELDTKAARDVNFQMFTNGPADVWLSGRHIIRSEEFTYNDLHNTNFKAPLTAGKNALLIRFEHVAVLNTPLGLALHLDVPSGSVTVRVPVQTPDVARRQALESAFEQVYPSRDIYQSSDEIRLMMPRLKEDLGEIPVELRSGKDSIKKAMWNTGAGPQFVALGRQKAGTYQIVLSDGANRRELKVRAVTEKWNAAPGAATTYEKRRRETLEAAARRAGNALDPKSKTPVNMWNSSALRGEIAKIELGRWNDVNASTLIAFIEGASRVQDGSDFRMVDLLGMQTRYGGQPQFPTAVSAAMEKCALGFRYWADEPGKTSANYFTENHRLAFHVSEVLAGQLYENHTFANNGKSGAWHREHGEKLVLDWLRKRGGYGFEEWDANGYLAADVVLLSHLDLAQNPIVKSLARQVLDKIYFSFALNSFKGSFGSTHGRTAVDYVKDARSEPVACLAYLGWGTGVLNDHADDTVGVACAHYQVPEVIQAIALEPDLWNRERQGLDPVRLKEGQGAVDKVTFKTPDFMLCSAQSWKAGQNGYQQHIWQATLGPDAPVFVTHPACISENGNRRPNFWMGNQTLPRVAQWKDTLIAVHQLRANDWLDFTHAYFPTFAFDEWKLDDNWVFARVGDGYLALTAARGLNLIAKGDSALRELRSSGRENLWLCQMGRRAQDGDFAAFQKQVLALPLRFEKLSVRFQTLRGDTLQFGWSEPLLVNEKEQAISDFKHFENQYCVADWPAKQLEIASNGQKLTLNFEA